MTLAQFLMRSMHLLFPNYVAILQAIAVLFCFITLLFSCEDVSKSSDKKIVQLVLTVGGADTPITFGADYNAVITVPYGTDLTTITVKTLVVSAKATVSIGESTKITVTAEDGSKQLYTVQIMVAPRTDTNITALTVTVAGEAYSSMGDNPVVTITNNSIAIVLPLLFGSTLPTNLSLTVLTLVPGASSTPAEGETLDLTDTGTGMISVQAEDPSVAVSYTVSVSIAQPVVTTYTGTDTLGIAVRDVVEADRSVSFAAMDTVIMVSRLIDVSVDWALGSLSGTKTVTAGALVLTQSDLAMFPAMADVAYALTVTANGQTSEGKDLFYYPGQVRTWRDLQGMRVDLTGTYRMMRDVSFPDDGNGSSTHNFEPLGGEVVPFSGIFDGGGHKVRYLFIGNDGDYVGLFGQLTGTARNVGLAGGRVAANGLVGSLVGHNAGVVRDAYATVAVTGVFSVGGLVGQNVGMIQGAYATGVVTGGSNFSFGGLVGTNSGGTIQRAYATGSVTGNQNLGGLVGNNTNNGQLQDVYATGAVTGSILIGGLVGNNSGGMVMRAYARGNVTRIAGSTSANFGRLLGTGSGVATGYYYSSQEEESQLLSVGADGATTPLTGTTGFDGTARTAASAQADFVGFDFTTNEVRQWIFIVGRWPALNLGDLQSAAEQPTQ